MKTLTELYKERKFGTPGVKLGMFSKVFCYLIIFTAAGMIFSSCAPGYVASEPRYDLEYSRPLAPGESYIWINGNWRWDRRSQIYVYENGYWAKPRNGHIYKDGYWETGPRGKYWRRGNWEKERNIQAYNRDRKNERDRDRDRDRDKRGKLYENIK